jgi:hypothetical protein
LGLALSLNKRFTADPDGKSFANRFKCALANKDLLRLSQLLEPRSQVDSITNRGIVGALFRADIPNSNYPGVDANSNLDLLNLEFEERGLPVSHVFIQQTLILENNRSHFCRIPVK